MLGLISVETGLNEIKAHLQNSGYAVVDMEEAGASVEAVIYTSEPCADVCREIASSSELFTVMVNASGLTPEQVAEQLSVRMGGRNIQELPKSSYQSYRS
jgi:hypothetical protein